MEKQYGRCTTNKLKDIQVDLKQDLKVESIKLRGRPLSRDSILIKYSE